MRDCHSSANENLLYYELPVYSSVLFMCNSPPSSGVSFIKELSLLCSHTCLQVYHSLLVPNCNSLLLLNKLIFTGKIADIFIFKVNTPLEKIENDPLLEQWEMYEWGGTCIFKKLGGGILLQGKVKSREYTCWLGSLFWIRNGGLRNEGGQEAALDGQRWDGLMTIMDHKGRMVIRLLWPAGIVEHD